MMKCQLPQLDVCVGRRASLTLCLGHKPDIKRQKLQRDRLSIANYISDRSNCITNYHNYLVFTFRFFRDLPPATNYVTAHCHAAMKAIIQSKKIQFAA